MENIENKENNLANITESQAKDYNTDETTNNDITNVEFIKTDQNEDITENENINPKHEEEMQSDTNDINEKLINEKANSFVENVIDSASLSFQSSGDYSLLNDDIKDKNIVKDEENLNQKDESFEILQTEENKKLDVLGNGLLIKEIISSGNGVKAERGQEVNIEVTIKLSSGDIVEENKDMIFIVADQEVVPALDLCVNLMELNERCEVFSDAKYSHGEAGKLPNIPPNSAIIYNIFLKEINEGPYNTSVPVRKRLDWVDKKRTSGNQLYMEKKFPEAIQTYMKCTKVLQQAQNQPQTEEIKQEIASFSLKCHNNLAASYMMNEDWKKALECCNVAELLDPNNVKTLFRKAKILIQVNEVSRAVNILKKAKELKPEDKAIQSELTRQTKRLTQQKEKQKKMYQKMIGVKPVPATTENNKSTNSNSFWASIFSPKSLGCSLVAVTGAVLLGLYFSHR